MLKVKITTKMFLDLPSKLTAAGFNLKHQSDLYPQFTGKQQFPSNHTASVRVPLVQAVNAPNC